MRITRALFTTISSMSIKQEKAALRKSIKEILGKLETSKINEQCAVSGLSLLLR